jgi:acyl transferase domain-containing protein/phosphopantetheinyl transferase
MANGDVAIVGMACLFPGARNLDAYWRNILGKVDATSDPPAESWDPDIHYDPNSNETDRVYCKRGGYLGPLAYFDPLAHGIPPMAVGGEPDQWLALQLARDALTDAGYTELEERVRLRTAIVLGKGTYLNTGNLSMVQHGLVISQTLEILKNLHPEYTEAELESIRREFKRALPPAGAETVPGLIPNVIVGRIANRLDLMGPTYTVDAACASSLIATQLATQDLLNGECDLALVGGSQVSTPVPILNVFCQLGALSRRQQIRPFDKDADGTLLGEGIGMVVLKRLADAERDGDRIYAVVKGVGVASDGRGVSVMAPRVEGEELALRRAYEAAGVSPDSVGLIEAHGTGTPLGDVVEVQALTRVFGQRNGSLPRCALGSVKSMISHTMPAAGIAGIIKTALALYHKVLPPTLNCETPNPKLGLENTPFYISAETRPWIHGAPEPRRAGVNAFGFGGINAHAVLEEYRGLAAPAHATHMPPQDSEVCILEAESPEALLLRARQLQRFLDHTVEVTAAESQNADSEPLIELCDVAVSLNRQVGTTGLEEPFRLAIVATSLHDLQRKLNKAVQRLADPTCRQIKDVSGMYFVAQPLGREGKLAFLFPGEGAQYPNMLADLCLRFPEVRECFDQIDRIFTGHPRQYVPSDYIMPRPAFTPEAKAWAEHHLWQMDGAIESVLTSNHAMLTLLSRLGLRPDAVVGHSTGEYSAMRAAGVLAMDGDERLARFALELNRDYELAAAREGVPRAAMLAVGTDRERGEAIAREANGEVYVAMDNCPHQTVLVGTHEAVERALSIVRREGLIYEHLTFDRAYHTHLFDSYTDQLKQAFDRLEVSAPSVPVYSCTTADRYPEDPAEIRRLMVDHWVRPVEFRQTIERLYADGVRLFVEVGPRGNLTSFVEDILRGRRFCAVPANTQRRSGVMQLNHLVAMLAVHGVKMDLSCLYERRQSRQIVWDMHEPTPELPAPPTKARMKLTTGFPMVRFSGESAQRLRSQASTHPAPASTPTEDLPTTQVSTANGQHSTSELVEFDTLRPEQVAPEQVAPEQVAPEQVAPEQVAPEQVAPDWHVQLASTGEYVVDSATSPPTPVIQHFLATMEQFLAIQQDVMQLYLQTNGRSSVDSSMEMPNALPPPWSVPRLPLPAESRDTSPAAEIAGEILFPLLGQAIAWTPEEELVTRRTFDPEEDLYLRDHTLGRAISDADPALLGLAVMPLTMSLEILAEAAACLLPQLTVTGMQDIRAHRWIAFEGHPQELQITARRLLEPSGGQRRIERVRVQIRNLTEDSLSTTPPKTPVLEATVVLTEAYSTAPPLSQLTLADERPSRWESGRLYSDAMFHGPCWQGVLSIERTGANGSVANLPVLPFTRFFRSNTEPRFVLDPVVLDAAGQVIGFWTMEHLSRGRVIFPYRVEALEVYGELRPAGELITCLAAIESLGDHHVRSNIEMAGADGRVWMRLVGWEDKRFDLPERFYSLLLSPRQAEISEAWQKPVRHLPEKERLQCRRVSVAFPSDRELWKRVWAGCLLSRWERELFAALRTPEHRQLEWLAGRAAAKESVRHLLRQHYGLEFPPADIEIHPDKRGRPLVRLLLPGKDPSDVPGLIVSIAHTDGEAVALATLRSSTLASGAQRIENLPMLGIDIERVRAGRPSLADLSFSAAEIDVLRGLAPAGNDAISHDWVLRAWCAKEAVGKALGYGLVEGPGSVRIVQGDAVTGTCAVELAGRLALLVPQLAAAHIIVHTDFQGDLVVATTTCQTGDVHHDHHFHPTARQCA